MIEIKNKQILIDSKPQIIMYGKIHYFRIERKDWRYSRMGYLIV